MTLSEVIIYINKALNFPSVSIADIDIYFNQAFSEINTQLHIAIPSLEEMRNNAIEAVTKYDNLVRGNSEPLSGFRFNTASKEDTLSDNAYFYITDAEDEKCFYYKGNFFEKIYYLFFDVLRKKYRLYESSIVDNGEGATWFEIFENPSDINLEDYLPKDWIFLFIIPYICFKQSVKDGDQGILFNQEMATGFNQLRDSYHIPEYVVLKEVIHLPAYRKCMKLIENNTYKWNQKIPTRAIYDAYKIPKAIDAVYMDFYNRGGWGI